ncbi:MAG: hypothetical protein LBG45_03740 [Dysgonamonadaceae bacterium]|nr:hypothetical protein [Dysgonamonadaceae bacterium]
MLMLAGFVTFLPVECRRLEGFITLLPVACCRLEGFIILYFTRYGFVHYRYPAGNDPVRDYSSVATFDRTAPRMTSVMRTNAASLRDAGEGGERYFLPSFASLQDAGSPFTVHHSPQIINF